MKSHVLSFILSLTHKHIHTHTQTHTHTYTHIYICMYKCTHTQTLPSLPPCPPPDTLTHTHTHTLPYHRSSSFSDCSVRSVRASTVYPQKTCPYSFLKTPNKNSNNKKIIIIKWRKNHNKTKEKKISR